MSASGSRLYRKEIRSHYLIASELSKLELSRSTHSVFPLDDFSESSSSLALMNERVAAINTFQSVSIHISINEIDKRIYD